MQENAKNENRLHTQDEVAIEILDRAKEKRVDCDKNIFFTSPSIQTSELSDSTILNYLYTTQEEFEKYYLKCKQLEKQVNASLSTKREVNLRTSLYSKDQAHSGNTLQLQKFFDVSQALRKSELENSLQYRIGNAIMSLKGLLMPFKLIRILLFFNKKAIPQALGSKEFEKVIEAHNLGGYEAVKKLLNSVKITSIIKADALTAVARHLKKDAPKECCKYAEYAYKTDPQPYRLKWWILRLYARQDYVTAGALLQLLSKDCHISDTEKDKFKQLAYNFTQITNDLANACVPEHLSSLAKIEELHKNIATLISEKENLEQEKSILKAEKEKLIKELANLKGTLTI